MRNKLLMILKELKHYNASGVLVRILSNDHCEDVANKFLKEIHQQLKDARNIDDLCERFGTNVENIL